MKSLIASFALIALPALAMANPLGEAMAEIYVLGEVHDNPAHHAVQAEAVAALAPRALVFEMLTEEQAGRATDDLRADPGALGAALDWEASGWPDFAMYYPIFAAADGAEIRGAAVPRAETRAAMQIGVALTFGDEAPAFGLTDELEAEELADRLNLQMAAHCNALPVELLPGMVDLQRLRDAVLARAALVALEETGGPVVVITGNGHARKDWGVPSYLARVAPDVAVFALGQGEDGGTPDGGFDLVLDAPGAEREDPCLAFR
ncbi:ChaN family lipoprotein [Sinisalibacter aestuarii]|uniref:Haem-binding uptake Tiki superfamily ChaN domain-containing protein n=1 Tax=Sinisalibacter aestuarii TaxID=2949426 RepID=A0ABQ5LX59_9RHOB|nr:ChaN family lipoprotein [Sinisalibacter aestuarii]GKY89353.1 hypothetical protein STA1M1_32220 [Sinisalibacter aestuarii]